MGELLTVVAVHAVVGRHPEQAVAVLDQAEHDQVAQPVGGAERAEPEVAERRIVGDRGRRRGSRHLGLGAGEPRHAEQGGDDGAARGAIPGKSAACAIT